MFNDSVSTIQSNIGALELVAFDDFQEFFIILFSRIFYNPLLSLPQQPAAALPPTGAAALPNIILEQINQGQQS